MSKRVFLPIFFVTVVMLLAGCQKAYYSAMEKVGVHKRDLLVSRVEGARDSQEEAKEQFKSALETFSEVVGFQGGDLETQYKKMKDAYDDSTSRSDAVHDRIDGVENVAAALFAEWEEELQQYSSASLKRSSKEKLDKTRRHYNQLIGAMKKAEAKIDPVLTAFNDQVLFLKHNLNAKAIASLRGELGAVESDIAVLIRDMEASIREADTFLKKMNEG